MKIGNVNQGKGVAGSKRTKGTSSGSGASFADKLRGAASADEAQAPAAMTDTASIGGVDALLAMQEVSDVSDREVRKKAVSYGDDLLDRLRVIQDALLAGGIPKEQLMTMAKKMRTERISVSDPELSSLLDEIELRVEVEIAKHTRGL
ncbi:MAG: flagellar assembly protein FliX [Rhodospirillaceae bacterium]|nr:MAG: flagellar assembly protein FliX [Rhodospirillaceae bacterium]